MLYMSSEVQDMMDGCHDQSVREFEIMVRHILSSKGSSDLSDVVQETVSECDAQGISFEDMQNGLNGLYQ